MTTNRLASAAARARWARLNDPVGYPEALAEHAEARLSRLIAEESARVPGMPPERLERLIRQLRAWDGTEPGSPEDAAEPSHVSFNFFPARRSIGQVISRTPKTLRARFPEGDYMFTQRSDGLYRLAGRSLEDQALDFIPDPHGLL